MIDRGDLAFREFVALRATAICRIARRTRGEFSILDVQGEAWLLAHELAGTDGITAFLALEVNQDKLLGYLYKRLVCYRECKIRHAVRLDQQEDDSPDKYDVLCRPGVGELADPLEILQTAESPPPGNEVPGPYDSPAAAFVHLLSRHGGSMRAVANYLRISVSHCYRRCAKARHLAEFQRSIPIHTGSAGGDLPLRPWRSFQLPKALRRGNLEVHSRNSPLL